MKPTPTPNIDLAPDRRERILRLVRERGTVRVSEVAEAFAVSEMTVRRDIAQLADNGLVERVHGGARAHGGPVSAEPLPAEKGLLNPEAKQAIARATAALVHPGEVIGIGSGTTTLAFARELVTVADLTIATNSVAVAQVFWEANSARVILTGGEITRSQGLVGPIALRTLEGLHLDAVVLGSHGIDPSAGCTAPNLLESQVNQLWLDRARRTMILADSAKWGIVGLTTFLPFSDIDMLITDTGMPEQARSQIAEAGIDLVIADD